MSISMFPTHDDPIQFVDLIKTISFAKGVYIVLDTDGNLQEGETDHEYQLSPHTITPLEASSTTDLNRYANQAIITIDEDWTEETSTETTTVETGYGISRTIVKIGDQLQSIDTDLGSGNGIEEEWTWDEDGNLTRYDKTETATLEIVTEYTTWSIDSGTGQFTVFQSKIVQKRANPLGSWYYYRKYESTTTTYLDDTAPVAIEEYTFWYFQEESAWHYKYWVHRVGLPQTPGIIESSRNDYYEYSETDANWHLQRTVNEGGLTRPEWTKMLQMDKIGMHFCATAEDEPSISLVGVIEKEFAAYGLMAIEDVEAAARNYLHYCQRADISLVEIPMVPCLLGDIVTWNGEEWTIEQVTHKLNTLSTELLISKTSSLETIKEASFGDPEDIGESLVKLLETKAKRLDNAARAKIIAQIDFETYQVHIQGEASTKVRTARVDYRRGETFQPGKEVLLVRPTGKRSGWEIVTRRNDPPTTMSTIQVYSLPPLEISVSIGRSIYEPTDTMMLYVQNLNRAKAIQVSWGDEGSEVVRSYTRGTTYGNQITDWEPAAANPLYEDWYYDNLEQRYAECLVREIVAPLDPEANSTQSCSGKIRIQGAFGEWSDWKTFSYEFRTPGPKKLEYTLGTPYYGETAADCDSAPVVDAAFLLNVDFSPWLAGRWKIEYGHMVDGAFVSLSTWSSVARTHFRRLNGTIAVPMTGRFVWRFSENGEDWHSTPTSNDLFVQVGNGTTWGDAYEVPHGTTTSFGTFGEIGLCPGDGTERLYDWFALEKDETGDATITIPCRLGYSGPGEHYSGSTSAAYNYGPPFPGIATEYHPFVYTDFSYSWDERGEVVS